jgi:hypothetical protein
LFEYTLGAFALKEDEAETSKGMQTCQDYGKAFGDANINIAGMQIARETAGGQALSVLTVDSRVPEDLLAEVAAKIEATTMAHIDIVEL